MFRINYSIVFVSNMGRSIEFYRDVLGIPLKFQTPGWTEFQTEGATLALHLAKPGDYDSMSNAEVAGNCRAGFQVESIDAFHQRMIDQNVTCKREPTETFGVRVAQYVDPDGLVFSVSGANG